MRELDQPANYTTKKHQYDITQYLHAGWAVVFFRGSHQRSWTCRHEDAEDAGSSVNSRLEQPIQRHKRSTRFCGSPNFALNHLSDGYPSPQCLIDVLAGHADHLSPSAKCVEAFLGEPAIAYENATCPCSLLIELALKRMEFGCPNRISDPLGLDQVRFISELKATVYLLANQTERRTRLKLGGVKKLFEKPFEFVATLLRWQISQVVQALL